jgi:hypothetical protein
MADSVDFGLPGVAVNPGDHIGGFFFGIEERDEVSLSFLRLSPDVFRLIRS